MSLFEPVNQKHPQSLIPERQPDGTNALPFVDTITSQKVSDGTYALPWLDERKKGWVIVKVIINTTGSVQDQLTFPLPAMWVTRETLVFVTHNENDARTGLAQLAAAHDDLPRRYIPPHLLFPPGGWYIQTGIPDQKVLLYKIPVIMTGQCDGATSTLQTQYQAGPYQPTWPSGTWPQQYGTY